MLIGTEAALAIAVAGAAGREPRFADLVRAGLAPTLRKREPGFAGLVSIMVGQQVSTASAAAIGGRLTAALGEVSAARIDAVGDDVLREAGLSRAKIATVRALAEAVRHGALDLEALGALPADEAHRRLVALRGIGPWTADVYLLFCLGHPDAFPAGDLALQEAARDAFALSGRPSAPELARLAERWRPWRGGAAYLLWAHYRTLKGRSGAPP